MKGLSVLGVVAILFVVFGLGFMFGQCFLVPINKIDFQQIVKPNENDCSFSVPAEHRIEKKYDKYYVHLYYKERFMDRMESDTYLWHGNFSGEAFPLRRFKNADKFDTYCEAKQALKDYLIEEKQLIEDEKEPVPVTEDKK